MSATYQLVIDCADPDLLARFWAAALHYEFEPPPEGFASWDDHWRSRGVPEEELGNGHDRISDPAGHGPTVCFLIVPESKTVKNRLHLDLNVSGGPTLPLATRRARVDAEATRLTALGATLIRPLVEEGLDHYAVSMKDPEGNEFDIN
jgi:glyoxalase superfamily protein